MPKNGTITLLSILISIITFSIVKGAVYAPLSNDLTVLIQETSLSIDIANPGDGPTAGQIQRILELIAEESQRQKKDPMYIINTLAEDIKTNPKSGSSQCLYQLAIQGQQLDSSVNNIISDIVRSFGSGLSISETIVNVVYESIASMTSLNFVSAKIQIETGSDTDPEKIEETVKEVVITTENKGGRGSGQRAIVDIEQDRRQPDDRQQLSSFGRFMVNVVNQKVAGNEAEASLAIERMATEIANGRDTEEAAKNAQTDGGTQLDDPFSGTDADFPQEKQQEPGTTLPGDESEESGNDDAPEDEGGGEEDVGPGDEEGSSGGDGGGSEEGSSGGDGGGSEEGSSGGDGGGSGDGGEG